MYGELQPIISNLSSIAHCDLNNERNCSYMSEEGRKAMQVMQCGMQYLLFAQQAMWEKIELLKQYTGRQLETQRALEAKERELKRKVHGYRKLDSKYNEQAIQFEVALRRF